jgi:hypothetical protein
VIAEVERKAQTLGPAQTTIGAGGHAWWMPGLTPANGMRLQRMAYRKPLVSDRRLAVTNGGNIPGVPASCHRARPLWFEQKEISIRESEGGHARKVSGGTGRQAKRRCR